MFDRAEFEQALRELSALRVGAASQDDATALDALREALVRLDQEPSLFSGEPGGEFTYEDPILATATEYARMGTKLRAGPAAPAGLSNALVHRWAIAGIRAWLSRKDHANLLLAGRTPHEEIVIKTSPARLAVLGDAGHASTTQAQVLQNIRARHQEKPFDLIVHLGDTYFAGEPGNVLEWLVAPLKSLGVRAVSLCGNHDLYSGASGYNAALTALDQPGRYFVIRTPDWQIACLDTALASERTLRNDGSLDPGQLKWLEDLILKSSAQPTLLMSHHFIVSDWEAPAVTLKKQVAQLVRDRVVAWYWGHEHRMVAYGRGSHGFHGACIGNGAFLESWSAPKIDNGTAEWYATSRCACDAKYGEKYWPHGYLELELDSEAIIETYHHEGAVAFPRRIKKSVTNEMMVEHGASKPKSPAT